MDDEKRNATNLLAAFIAGIIQGLIAMGLIYLVHNCVYG